MSSSFLDVAAKFRAVGSEVNHMGVTNVLEGAKLVEGAVALASGKYRGKRIVRTQTKLIPGKTPRAEVKMPSRLAHLLDHDTRPHEINPKVKTFLAIGPTTFVAAVSHPGTKGKLMWEHGVDLALPKIRTMAESNMAALVGKVFH